jgi:hypothetical protein
MNPTIRSFENIGHKFTARKKLWAEVLLPEEERQFLEMLEQHGNAFVFSPNEIGCDDPCIVEPMVIFTISHTLWNLKPITVPRAHIAKLIVVGIIEPSNVSYSNRWFTVPKKNDSFRFMQDLQPMSKVTIWNSGVGSIVDEFAEAFAGHATYSIGDLYVGYLQFQLAMYSGYP